MGNSAGALKHHIETAEKTGALAFSDKKLKEFPSSLSKTAHVLRSLDLCRNQIDLLPPTVAAFKALKTLRLSDNRLTALPAEIGALVKLESLHVANNRLTSLPESMASLKALKELDASSNRISSFPAFVLGLKKVDTLDLSQNVIETLPEDSSALSATEVNMNSNRLRALPASLARCVRLRTLRVQENCLPLEGLPEALLAEGSVSTLALAGNLFDEKALADKPGYEKYMERFTNVRRKMD